MYQKVIIVITALAIGIFSSLYTCGNVTGNVTAMWGFMYPQLCFVEGTYSIDEEVYTIDAYKKLLTAEPGQIKVKLKFLELLEERR
ncbi:MAG TPA: hypothetical protein VJZ01_11320 [Lachnospiraceae bacterium]|jgi:hypothetical protein|nr:hypothetical protein [Lachnospiraceae bacterium]